MMRIEMSPEAIDALGTIFVHLRLGDKYGITFERFVELKATGKWEAFVCATC